MYGNVKNKDTDCLVIVLVDMSSLIRSGLFVLLSHLLQLLLDCSYAFSLSIVSGVGVLSYVVLNRFVAATANLITRFVGLRHRTRAAE